MFDSHGSLIVGIGFSLVMDVGCSVQVQIRERYRGRFPLLVSKREIATSN